MPIVTMQRQFRELGRLRLGQQVEFTTKAGKKGKRPEKLGTWRLTSPDRGLLDRAAEVYGGAVEAWPEAPDGDEFQLISAVDELDVLIPRGNPLSQWNEMWSGGGCQRRCDGEREWLSNRPCLCPADPTERNELASKGEACKPTTRLSVILPKLPDLGTWLYASHGYYAAVELAGTAELLAAVGSQAGRMLEARLWIDQRTVKRPNQAPRHFPVAALRIAGTMTELLASAAPAVAPQLEGGRIPPALPEPPDLPADATLRIAATEQPAQGGPSTESGDIPETAETKQSAPAPASCPHPEPYDVTTQGIVCKECGELVARRDDAPLERPRRAAADADRDRARAFGMAAKRPGVDDDALRHIGAAIAGIPVTEVEGWSRSNLSADQWRQVADVISAAMPDPTESADQSADRAWSWAWAMAMSQGIGEGKSDEGKGIAIQTLARDLYRKPPFDLSIGEWLGFGVRLRDGTINQDAAA